MPRFSILIPVYNVKPYLDDCLRNVHAQPFTDFEVIAVDDGSTDGSGELLERYRTPFAARKIPYTVIHQENQGLSAARNTALDHATGEYVLFLDSDDILSFNALSVLERNLHGEDILCFNGKRYFEKGCTVEEPEPMQPEGPLSGWEYFNRHALEAHRFAFVCVVLRCYRRQFLLDNGLRFRPGIYHEDNLFTPQACYYAKTVTVIPDALYVYRIRSESITAHRSLKHKQDILSIANELSHFFIPKDSIDKSIIYRLLTHLYQTAFAESTPEEDRRLLPLVDWPTYRQVSRTKLRHRILFAALRISPCIFRRFLKLLSFKSGRRQEYAPTEIKCPDSLS